MIRPGPGLFPATPQGFYSCQHTCVVWDCQNSSKHVGMPYPRAKNNAPVGYG